MRLRMRMTPMVIAALLLLAPIIATAKNARANRRTEFLAGLKIGQWIAVVGEIQKDGSVQCTELKLLAGDFVDDDWNLIGPVGPIDLGSREFTIARIQVHLSDNTQFESEGALRSARDLKQGMMVEVDGTYTHDGFMAKEVDDESREYRGADKLKHIRLVGRLERAGADHRRIVVMGTPFLLTESTQLKSMLR